MTRWTCPRCDREFARPHQSHTCVPGRTVDAVFAQRPGAYREIYGALLSHLHTLGPVHEDAVGVGVFLKRHSKLAEIRPMARALSVDLVLPSPVASPRVHRRITVSAARVVHVLRLREPNEVDDELRTWLTIAYDAAGPPSPH